MYVPPHFKIHELAEIHEIIRAARLANFVTATPQGLMASPLPLFLVPSEGEYGTLYGHVAKPNLQWQQPVIGEAMALFNGPEAYVTPSWYASKQEHGRVVPTWNYIAVHAYGTAEFFQDEDRLHQVVTQLTDLHEQSRSHPWQVNDAPASYIQGQLRGIVGLRMPIARIDAKRKMSQNRSVEDRQGVAKGLGASARQGDQDVANLIATSGRE